MDLQNREDISGMWVTPVSDPCEWPLEPMSDQKRAAFFKYNHYLPVSLSMIKQNIDIFVPYITKLVNESLSSGCFPDSLKVSYIRPLIKRPNLDKEIFKNYRPVANLKYLGKVIERVVSSRISDHIHTRL